MKEAKELVLFMVEAGNSIDKSFSDGKIDSSDLVNLLPLVLKAPEALKGIDKIVDELKAASSQQREVLVQEVKDALDLRSDKTEKMIEASLVFANQIIAYLSLIKEAKGK